MARDHIEFIQAQVLPWESADGWRPGTRRKVLSHDSSTGAASLVLGYPAGWTETHEVSLVAAEEFYLLSGELMLGNVTYGPGDYAYLPAGYQRCGMRAGTSGAVALAFFSAEPLPGDPQEVSAALLVERLATNAMDWDSNVDPKVVGNQPAKKTLRVDPDTGDSTWILTIGAMDPGVTDVTTPLEKHPYVEEMFQLDGEISTNVGVMRRGAYFWRPPFVSHGPIASQPGFTALFRSHGGSRTTDWSAATYPVVWDPPYRPVLPEGLHDLAHQPFDDGQPY